MKKWNELTMIEKVKLITLLVSVILLTILVIQNYKAVQLSIFFWDLKISLIVLIALSGGLGFLISFLKDSIKIKRIKEEMAVLKGLKKGIEQSNAETPKPEKIITDSEENRNKL
jgi:uncharacterized integral membrane protein